MLTLMSWRFDHDRADVDVDDTEGDTVDDTVVDDTVDDTVDETIR